jgi:hypothetical protein
VITNGCTLSPHIDIVDSRHWNNYMGHAAVDEVNRLLFISCWDRDVESQIGGLSHLQRNEIIHQLR